MRDGASTNVSFGHAASPTYCPARFCRYHRRIRMDTAGQTPAPASSDVLAGEMTPLTEAVGSPAGLATLSALADLVDLPRPNSVPSVRLFLERFRERLLIPVELPAISEAYGHASRGELRELIALDRRLAARYGTSAFAEASRHVGRIQLRRLRPMAHRTVRRFLEAVEAGEATGWHVVVYGLLLAVFSMPLPTALLQYAVRTQHSLLESAANATTLAVADLEALRRECSEPAMTAVRQLLPFGLKAV